MFEWFKRQASVTLPVQTYDSMLSNASEQAHVIAGQAQELGKLKTELGSLRAENERLKQAKTPKPLTKVDVARKFGIPLHMLGNKDGCIDTDALGVQFEDRQ